MNKIILDLAGVIGVYLTAVIAIASFLEEFWSKETKEKLKIRFENWWYSVADLDRFNLSLIAASKLSQITDIFFGQHLFSKQCFYRVFVCSTGLLLLSMAITGVPRAKLLGAEPWDSYQNSLNIMQSVFQKAKDDAKTDTEKQANEQVLDVINKYNKNTYSVIYAIIYFLGLVMSNCLLCFLSLAYSRITLREIVNAKNVFATIMLSLMNLFLVTVLSAFFLLFLVFLGTPIIWFFAFLVLIFSLISIWIPIGAILIGGFSAFVFTGTSLKIVAIISFLPMILATLTLSITSVALTWRTAFKKSLEAILLKCADLGPAKVVAVVFGATAALITLVAGGMH